MVVRFSASMGQDFLPQLQSWEKEEKLLCVVGPADVYDEVSYFEKKDTELNDLQIKQDEILENGNDVRLYILSGTTGRVINSYQLDGLPVWDGLIAANGKLFLSMKNGKVICFGK